MDVTATDFERITGVSRHTVYSWYYRKVFPEGISEVPTIGKARILSVNKKSSHYEKINKALKK